MPGEMAQRRLGHMELRAFHAFRDGRPRREKWELIDGVAIMMAPPSLVHQRICRNLETMLNDRLRNVRPEWAADREIGVLLPADEKYNPEPDVTVIDKTIEMGQLYAQRFYFVAEVLSASDKDWVLTSKLDYYQRHENCQSVLFVRQDRIGAEFYRRGDGWAKADMTDPREHVDVPGIGDIGPLSGLYLDTPLASPPDQG
jgi:Uma2 family endonuclease